MYIRSTGLGRTLLTCRVAKIEVTRMVPATLKDPEEGREEPERLLMTIQTTDPVKWTVRAFVEPDDLRAILRAALRPSVVWAALKFLLFGRRRGHSPAEAPAAGTSGRAGAP